jgi:hypothetical protein
VAVEGPGYRDVAYPTVFRVNLYQRLHVSILFEPPQSFDESVRHLSGHAVTSLYIYQFISQGQG